MKNARLVHTRRFWKFLVAIFTLLVLVSIGVGGRYYIDRKNIEINDLRDKISTLESDLRKSKFEPKLLKTPSAADIISRTNDYRSTKGLGILRENQKLKEVCVLKSARYD